MEAGARAENENNQENIGERQENLQQEANANVNVVDENEERRELIEPQNQGENADGAILNEIEPVQDDLPANNAAMFGGQLRESESLIKKQNERINYLTTLVQSMLQQQIVYLTSRLVSMVASPTGTRKGNRKTSTK